MRRWTTLLLVTPLCWALAAACAGDGGQAPAPEVAPTTGASGQVGPGGGSGPGGVGGDVVLVPSPQLGVALAGKAIVQDGSYPVGKLTAHASDPKNAATTFHWALMGPGIAGGVFGDGADFSYELPVPTDKSNYVLTVIAKLGGKAVQKDFSFFTVPAPSAKIVANINQAAGVSVAMPDGGTVLKGKKVAFSADAKFANQYKWQISKDGAKAQDLGTAATASFDATELGQYQVALQVWGDGGFSPMVYLNFSVGDGVAVIDVKTSVIRDASQFSDVLKNDGLYPIDSIMTIDASGIGDALSLMTCTVKSFASEFIPTSKTNSKVVFELNKPGKYTAQCTYTLKADYIPKDNAPLSSTAIFLVLPKAKAVMTLDGKACDPTVPLSLLAGSDVKLSANNSTGNISTYLWKLSSGNLENENQVDAVLHLANEPDLKYKVTLDTNGIGDSDSVSCTVIAKESPNAVIASGSTVQNSRSYIAGSYQRAYATVKSGELTGFDWSLSNEAGAVLKQATTQKASDIFEFALNEIGSLTLKLISKSTDFAVPESVIKLGSKVAQVSLITPIDFSTIQSVAAVNDTDVYFASPSAIFHKGVDGRVVQVKNIADHPALPDGFFARNAGDIYLMTTDGGFWRYTFKEGWVFTALGGTNQALSGSSTGTRLFRVSSSRLFSGDIATGAWTKINDGSRYVTTMGNYAYAAGAASVANGAGGTDPAVVKCSTTSCSALKWDVDAGAVTWKSIGASASVVFLSTANGRVYTIQNNLVTKLGSLSNDDYVVAFSRAGTSPYAIGNKGGVYRLTSTGVVLYYTAPATVTAASGVDSTFYAWDDAAKVVMRTEKDNLQTVAAQKSLGTPPAGCVDQKQMWVVGDTAYVSVCAVPAGKSALYTIWSAPYQGNFIPNGFLVDQTPVVAVTDDGAGGILVMRSDGANANFIQQQQIDGTLKAINVPLQVGEVMTGMNGKFFITNKGIRVNDGQVYPTVVNVTDASHPVAVGDVLYYTFGGNTRLARVDLKNAANTGNLANVDAADAPIVDVVVDVNQRVYVLTAKTLYRYDNGALAKVYEAPAAMLNSMASMNGHHLLLSMASKGLVLMDVDGKSAQIINVSTETPSALETTDVGYNGTEFLFFGRDVTTNARFIHQFGAPQ